MKTEKKQKGLPPKTNLQKTKKTSKKKESSNSINKKSIIGEIKDELKKVKWASKEDMAKYGIAVVLFVILFAIYFFAFDIIFSWISSLVKGL